MCKYSGCPIMYKMAHIHTCRCADVSIFIFLHVDAYLCDYLAIFVSAMYVCIHTYG